MENGKGLIAIAGRKVAERNSGGKSWAGDLLFDGVWESLRRAVGAGDCGGYVGMAKRYSRANGFACGYGGQCFAETGRRFVPQREGSRRWHRARSSFAQQARERGRENSLSLRSGVPALRRGADRTWLMPMCGRQSGREHRDGGYSCSVAQGGRRSWG